ncbi:MAG: ferrochelatase [Chloroflexi bacterium]|nr:ferrochelatase [Chloroflexota bacterium]
MKQVAVLLMAYGTPNSLDDVEAYYADIRGGRKPSPELVHELKARYERIGGKTLLLEITRAQANGVQNALGDDYRVYVGMKHWRPYIAQTVEEIARRGHTRVIALALAPHYSRFSIDGYAQRVRAAMDNIGATFDVTFVQSWNDEPLYIASLVERMDQTRAKFEVNDWADVHVIFSAHSLPERILQGGDPYPQELRETCELVAAQLGLQENEWRFAYQSAGRTGEKWLGPDILDALDMAAHQGHKRVMIAPIGFVADHLEILYDIDVECAERARALGIEMQRIPSANASPTFVAALEAVVRTHVRQDG